MKIASWNVNSLNVRLPQVLDWIDEHQPDLLALQETKVTDEKFPREPFEERGVHFYFNGQRTYNGVAIISKQEGTDVVTDLPALEDPQRRVLAATFGDVRLINLYVPNGQRVDSEKFTYKLDWLKRLRDFLEQELRVHEHVAVVGDFNIAPADADVHDPQRWEGSVLVSPPERQALADIQALGLSDTFRLFEQAEKSFSWWDYRAGGFRRNHGLRIDLVLASKAMAERCIAGGIDVAPRKLERPSDHTPVWADFT